MRWKNNIKRSQVRGLGSRETCTIYRLTAKPLRSTQLQATVSSGVSSIVVTSTKQAGTAPLGAVMTIAGDATEYTLTADATADESTDRATLTFTPVLAAGATVGATVTISANAQYTYYRVKQGLDDEILLGTTKGADRKVVVWVQDGEQIRSDDVYEDDLGRFAILGLESRDTHYKLMLRGAA